MESDNLQRRKNHDPLLGVFGSAEKYEKNDAGLATPASLSLISGPSQKTELKDKFHYLC